MKLTPYERETIINYNEGEKTASVYTHNTALRRRLDQVFKTRSDEMEIIRSGEDYTEYVVPRKWIKVSPPRQTSEEAKERARQRMNDYWQSEKVITIDSQVENDDLEL